MAVVSDSVPLSFEKGLNREFLHETEPGSAQRLINWEPQPDGSLVARRRWQEGSEDGAPVARKVRAIGVLPVLRGVMTPVRRQRLKRVAKGTEVSAIDGEWRQPTLDDSLLIAVVSWSDLDGAAAIDVTPPAGWTSLGRIDSNDAPITLSQEIFSIEAAADREGTDNFVFTAPVRRASLELMEWRGVETDGTAHDVYEAANGFSTKPDTGFSVATDVAHPKQLVIGAISGHTLDSSIKPSQFPPNWFEFTDPIDPPHRSVGGSDYWLNTVVARTVTIKSGVQRFSAHYDESEAEDDAKSRWVAQLVTFRAKERSTVDQDFYLVDTEEDADTHALFELDLDLLDSDPWVNFGDIISEDGDVSNRPLAFAAGAGGVVISATDALSAPGAAHKGLFHYDGNDLLRVNRSPRGQSVAFHHGRFWSVGTHEHPNYAYWSAVGDATMWDEDQWFIEVGSDQENLLDVAPVNEGLLFAKRDSLHFMTGVVSQSVINRLPGGGGMPGRCICPIPGGAVIAGRHNIWLWGGGAPRLISKALDDWWVNPDRNFVYSAYVNGLVYISGADEDTCVVYDPRGEGRWWTDQPPELVRVVFSYEGRELVAGVEDSADRFLLYQHHPDGTRGRDEGSDELYHASTQEMMLGTPSRPATPKWLHVAFRIRDYQAGHPGVSVTPDYDGVAHNARTIPEAHPVSGQVFGDGAHRLRLDVGEKGAAACHKVRFEFEYDADPANSTVFDIEAVELVYDIEERR